MFGFKSSTPEDKFWKWFVKHEKELFDFEADQERVFGLLLAELHRINPDLTFEFGRKGTSCEFVLSADGIKSAFPAVVALRSAAPKLERWQVTAFRPRRHTLNTIRINDKTINPEEVQFSLLDNGRICAIYLFLPGFRHDAQEFKQIGYLLLDEALGEYDVETGLAGIEMLGPEAEQAGDRYPLKDLPRIFDEHTARLKGKSGKPS